MPASCPAPARLLQGEADDSVLPLITAKLVDDLGAPSRAIEYRTYPARATTRSWPRPAPTLRPGSPAA